MEPRLDSTASNKLWQSSKFQRKPYLQYYLVIGLPRGTITNDFNRRILGFEKPNCFSWGAIWGTTFCFCSHGITKRKISLQYCTGSWKYLEKLSVVCVNRILHLISYLRMYIGMHVHAHAQHGLAVKFRNYNQSERGSIPPYVLKNNKS